MAASKKKRKCNESALLGDKAKKVPRISQTQEPSILSRTVSSDYCPHVFLNLSSIANDILFVVALHLTIVELCRLCSVSKSFQILFSHSKIWGPYIRGEAAMFKVNRTMIIKNVQPKNSQIIKNQEKNTYRRYWLCTKDKLLMKLEITDNTLKPKKSQKIYEKDETNLRVTMSLKNISNADIHLIKMVRPNPIENNSLRFVWAFRGQFIHEDKAIKSKKFQLIISQTEQYSGSPLLSEQILKISPSEIIQGKSIFWKEGPAITLPVNFLLKNLKYEPDQVRDSTSPTHHSNGAIEENNSLQNHHTTQRSKFEKNIVQNHCDSQQAETAEDFIKQYPEITLKVWLYYTCKDETKTMGVFRSNSIFLKFLRRKFLSTRFINQ